MSTHETHSELSSSHDCPIIGGVRAIQWISARSAEVGGGIPVSRLLPSRHRRMIGAWCFLDHAGPAVFKYDNGLRVGPHPHIGLQTFTWMIEGEVLHRDSLGNTQVIRPGQVNLMTAGYGITHTEESLPGQEQLHAVQLWIALPSSASDRPAAFTHYGDLPRWHVDDFDLTLLAGVFEHHHAPACIYSPLMGIDLVAGDAARTRIKLDKGFEYGILPLEGQWRVNSEDFGANELAYLGCGLDSLELQASPGARAILVGGRPFEEEIFLWWNYVGHTKEAIIQAPREWEDGSIRFGDVTGFDGARLTAPTIPWRA